MLMLEGMELARARMARTTPPSWRAPEKESAEPPQASWESEIEIGGENPDLACPIQRYPRPPPSPNSRPSTFWPTFHRQSKFHSHPSHH